MATVLLPLPDTDFDVTEVAVPWKVLTRLGHTVVFATEHGVLVLARTVDPYTGKSVLFARQTTCLTRKMERTAYWLTAWKLGRYYRTYPDYVEDEVRAALRSGDQLRCGPRPGTARGTDTDDAPAFIVEDANYVSARWPGDAYLFAKRFAALLP